MNNGHTMPDHKRVALVIGAGAVKCAAALGLWKVLQREGISIDLFVGCSGGSLFAAPMALGFSLDECVGHTKRLWNRRVTAKRHWPSLLKAILPGPLRFDERFGMIDDRPMLEALRAVFGEHTFADAHVPLHIVATDFHNGEQVVLNQGNLVDALRASIAIPYVWPAWPYANRLLIDGSLANPLPIDVAILQGADLILAMGFEAPYPKRVKSITRFAFHINSIITNNLYRANYAFHNLAHHAEIVTILPEFDRPVRLFDTQEIEYVIEQGERTAEAQLPYLQRLLSQTTQAL